MRGVVAGALVALAAIEACGDDRIAPAPPPRPRPTNDAGAADASGDASVDAGSAIDAALPVVSCDAGSGSCNGACCDLDSCTEAHVCCDDTHTTCTNDATRCCLAADTPVIAGSKTSVTLSCASPHSVIYYTMDGTRPTVSSPDYTGPFSVEGSTLVQAFCLAPGYSKSKLALASF